MRGKDFNTGLRGVLFEARHYERMGSAVWLYAWLVLRQTHQSGSTGWVLGGAPVRYREIEEETGFNVRTLERWMQILRRHGYVDTEPVPGGLIVRITKAKKHSQTARNPAASGTAETLRGAADGIRKLANAARNSAEGDTQNCVAGRREIPENTRVPRGISSSFIEESLERYPAAGSEQDQTGSHGRHKTARTHQAGFQSQTENQVQIQNLKPSCSGENQNQDSLANANATRDLFAEPGRRPNVRVQPPRQSWLAIAEARMQQQRWRAEREEAVRRELHVGAGPEVKR
jgi:hypothetical protein